MLLSGFISYQLPKAKMSRFSAIISLYNYDKMNLNDDVVHTETTLLYQDFLFQKVLKQSRSKSKFISVLKSDKIPLVFFWWHHPWYRYLGSRNVRFTLDVLSSSNGHEQSPDGKADRSKV